MKLIIKNEWLYVYSVWTFHHIFILQTLIIFIRNMAYFASRGCSSSHIRSYKIFPFLITLSYLLFRFVFISFEILLELCVYSHFRKSGKTGLQ